MEARKLKYEDYQYITPSFKPYYAIDKAIICLFKAKEKGEHVYFEWHNINPGQDNFIFDSEKLNTIDDAYLLFCGKTLAEELEERKKDKERRVLEEKEEQKRFEKFKEDHFEEMIIGGEQLFSKDAEKKKKWQEKCVKSKENETSFYMLYDVYRILVTLKVGLSDAIEYLKDMELRSSGISYNIIKGLVLAFSEQGAELYGEYEKNEPKIKK